MINLFQAFYLSLLALLATTQGFCSELRSEMPSCCFLKSTFDVKAGYFFFSDAKMRKVYDKGGLDIQLSASYPLWKLSHCWTVTAYGAVEYFQRSGRSINGHQKTSLWSVPINLGLKPIYAINDKMQYYFALGPRYFHIQQHNHSSYVFKNKSGNCLGFFANTGFNYLLCNHFLIDIFGEYSFGKMHFHSGRSRIYTRNIQIGGFAMGGGIGYEF